MQNRASTLTMPIRLVDDAALRVEPQDVITHTWRSTCLHLMLVPKQSLPSNTTPIVEVSVCEHSKEGTLTGIHIPHYGHPTRGMKRYFIY